MIKLALKHWTLEKCIDLLFDSIQNNFLPHSKKNRLEVGKWYRGMIFRYENNKQYHMWHIVGGKVTDINDSFARVEFDYMEMVTTDGTFAENNGYGPPDALGMYVHKFRDNDITIATKFFEHAEE